MSNLGDNGMARVALCTENHHVGKKRLFAMSKRVLGMCKRVFAIFKRVFAICKRVFAMCKRVFAMCKREFLRCVREFLQCVREFLQCVREFLQCVRESLQCVREFLHHSYKNGQLWLRLHLCPFTLFILFLYGIKRFCINIPHYINETVYVHALLIQ